MRVSYVTEHNISFSEYVCFEHEGYAGHKASQWFKFRISEDIAQPNKSMDCVRLGMSGKFKRPLLVQTIRDGKYFRLVDVRF
jgi:DNA repair protein RadD